MIFFVGRMPKAAKVSQRWSCFVAVEDLQNQHLSGAEGVGVPSGQFRWITRLVELCETGSLHNLGQPRFRPNKKAESVEKKRRVFCFRKLCGVGKVEICRICHEQQGSTSQPFREATMEGTMEVSHRTHRIHMDPCKAYLPTFR